MYRVEIERPNTIGKTFEREFESWHECEDWIERRIERWCDDGWQATDVKGSSSRFGATELVHDNYADLILISWERIG